jgi:hypothetical protein
LDSAARVFSDKSSDAIAPLLQAALVVSLEIHLVGDAAHTSPATSAAPCAATGARGTMA